MSNEVKPVFVRESGLDILKLTYYPGMVDLMLLDGWNSHSNCFNVSLADWRAMNVAVEACHNGGYNGS